MSGSSTRYFLRVSEDENVLHNHRIQQKVAKKRIRRVLWKALNKPQGNLKALSFKTRSVPNCVQNRAVIQVLWIPST